MSIQKDNMRKAAWKQANREKQRGYDRAYRKAHREKAQAWAKTHKRKSRKYKKRTREQSRQYTLKAYGLTPAAFKKMHDEQEGCCKICGAHAVELHHKKLSIDHDHKTGKVRGLLCGICNIALGGFQDNPELLRKAAAYLEQYR